MVDYRPSSREYDARLERVIKSDLFDLIADVGLRTNIEPRVRLFGIDTADLIGGENDAKVTPEGLAHRRFVDQWFGTAIAEHDDDWPLTITIESIIVGSNDPWAVDISRKCDGERLSAALFEEFGEAVERAE